MFTPIRPGESRRRARVLTSLAPTGPGGAAGQFKRLQKYRGKGLINFTNQRLLFLLKKKIKKIYIYILYAVNKLSVLVAHQTNIHEMNPRSHNSHIYQTVQVDCAMDFSSCCSALQRYANNFDKFTFPPTPPPNRCGAIAATGKKVLLAVGFLSLTGDKEVPSRLATSCVTNHFTVG